VSVGVNPLVVSRTGGATNEWSGVYLAEDIQLLHQGVKSGSWIDLSLGGVGATLDTLGLVTDPLGTLASAAKESSPRSPGQEHRHDH
jgi:hypothetical protein